MTIDDNGIGITDGTHPITNSGDTLIWDGSQWITVPATPLTNGTPVTISGSNGGTVTINSTGISVGNVITSANNPITINAGTPYITWVQPLANSQQLELELTEPENKENSEGCTCKKCKELFPYAESPKDGSAFICWGCQHF